MNTKPKVGVVIINYNGASMLEHCIDELLKIEYENIEIVLLDNASTDNSVSLVRNNYDLKLKVHVNDSNSGYSGGAEVACRMAIKEGWEYVMLMNPDIIFEPNYLDLAIAKLEEDAHIGALIGKLKQYKFFDREKTNIIDSAGLQIFRDRRVMDRGQSTEDKGQFDQEEVVFGITGAAPLYRTAALQDIEIKGEIFDQDFFMYKEDVDVSWRLNLFGWTNYYLPQAVAYHGRGTGIEDRQTYMKVAGKRKNLSRFQKSHSFRNHHFLLIKNEFGLRALKDIPFIVGKEILQLGFALIFEIYLYKNVWEVIVKLPKMLSKRFSIMRKKRVTSDWMTKFV